MIDPFTESLTKEHLLEAIKLLEKNNMKRDEYVLLIDVSSHAYKIWEKEINEFNEKYDVGYKVRITDYKADSLLCVKI